MLLHMLFFTAAILLYAVRDAPCKTKANATLLLLVLSNNVTISRLNRIGRQLHPVELAAGELADNFSLVL